MTRGVRSEDLDTTTQKTSMIEVKLTPEGLEVVNLATGGLESLVLDSAEACDELVKCLMFKRSARWYDTPTCPNLVLFRPLEGDRIRVVEFMKQAASRNLVDYDGHGYWSTEDMESNHRITPSQALEQEAPAWATHVSWYNR